MKKNLVTILITIALAIILTACGRSGKTIIDKIPYSSDGTMISEAKKYMDSKDLIYEERGGIHNTVADKFLGYRAYYDIDADDFYIYLTFDSEKELTKASKAVKKYFEGMEDRGYKRSELHDRVEENPSVWQDVFDGDSGKVYVIDYKKNKDDTFNYEAVMYCTMSDLDMAKAANGYVLGELNTYIAISVKGAKEASLEDISYMLRSDAPVVETDSAAAETDSAAVETDSAAAETDSAVVTDSAASEVAESESKDSLDSYELLSSCINSWNEIDRNAFRYSFGYIGDFPAVFAVEPYAGYRVKLLYVDDDKVIDIDLGTWKDETYYYKDCVCGYNPTTDTIIYEVISQVADEYVELQLMKLSNSPFPSVVKGCRKLNDDTLYEILECGANLGLEPVYNSMDGTYRTFDSFLYAPEGSGTEAMIEEIENDFDNLDVIHLEYYEGGSDFLTIELFDSFDEAYEANSDGCPTDFLFQRGYSAPG